MINKRFFLSWIIAAIVMFILSYLWHGIFLNDLKRLAYPREIYFVVASIVYLIIGLLIAKTYSVKITERFKEKPLLKGLIAGLTCGFLIYLVTMVVGVSFSKTMTLENIIFDLSWQVIEQGIGGTVVGLVHVLVYDEHFQH